MYHKFLLFVKLLWQNLHSYNLFAWWQLMWSWKSGSIIVISQYLQFTDWTILWHFHKWRWSPVFLGKAFGTFSAWKYHDCGICYDKKLWCSSSYSPFMNLNSPRLICPLLIWQYSIDWNKIRKSESLYCNDLWVSF